MNKSFGIHDEPVMEDVIGGLEPRMKIVRDLDSLRLIRLINIISLSYFR